MIEYCFKIGAMNKEQTDEVDLKMMLMEKDDTNLRIEDQRP